MQRTIDRLAVTASAVCAVHCAVLPLAASLVPAMFLNAVDDGVFHLLMLLFVLPCACASVFVGCRRHKNVYVLLCLLVGTATITFAALAGHDVFGEAGERIVTLIGSLCLSAGHIGNYYLCRHDKCQHR